MVLILILLLSGSSGLRGQGKQLTMWLEDLLYLQNVSAGELSRQQAVLAQIHAGIRLWLKLHPDSTVELPEAPVRPWSDPQMRRMIASMRATVVALLEQDPARPFELGKTEVTVTAEAAPLSPATGSIDYTAIRNLYAGDVAKAIQYLPGVMLDHNSARGQAGIMIRGFDSRQVGFYLDGIPVYVPFDGFADVSRFLTSGLGMIEVGRGYSSPFLGPNGLGGAVNLVTRQPEKRLDADAAIGTGSGNKLESWLHLGSRRRRVFFQGGVDWMEIGHFPVSGAFVPNELQPGRERTNSYRRDAKYSARIGWTPKGQDLYVLSYHNQKADYGVPPYSGIDPQNNKPKFWQWPYWNKESIYFNSSTGLGEANAIRFRAFYDRYRNSMNGFSDGSYSSLSTATPYDDHSEGIAGEFSSRFFSRQIVGGSFFLKDDIHKETAISWANNTALAQPWRTQHDRVISIGFQDVVAISSRLRATAGISVDRLDAVQAQDLQSTGAGSGKNAVVAYSVVPFRCPGSGESASFSSCLNRVWDFNPLASLSYSVSETGTLFFSFARKSHFPTLKDRYSYRYGKAIPNPALKAEHARNWSLGYSQVLGLNTIVQLDLFRSDVFDVIRNAIVPAEYENQCPGLAAGNCQQSVNAGKELHQGVEFAVRSTPFPRLSLDANYSFLHWTISGPANALGVDPTRAPKHRAAGSASVSLPRQILLLASARYESGTITTNDAGVVVPASRFATADLGLIVPVKSGIRMHAGVQNLFDRNYYYREGFPEPGRTWHLSLRYRF